ncbi:NUDIX domain-containing protein [Planococcus sp. YIM B11945]|uniref:NUDIX domain-containing protein n=1 Tax=Planococcus sp. YIM B11945 TaxID=3435410 RepID=UPI003D7DE4C5
MRYVKNLREKVGNEPLLLVKISIVVFDRQGNILLKKEEDGHWCLPCGFMEVDESTEEAGRRKVKEDTGIEVGELSLLGIFSGKKYFQETESGEQFYPITINYHSTDIRSVEDQKDFQTIRFFPIDRLPAHISLHTKKVIHHYGSSFY